ncbi:hypothetical protein DI09_1p390 [Mitosporidium daphniae]|uniref:Uncharacterized protein n=1 Tax=Mitosporidium daphniae TaxID=1485682 RepID=A0A098VTM8_9MICR|nr:uncharacterized protein DI09_1p390 [Mitosporidium daphniae]KGG52189.1 hypothetical protein DI09_1p390 [Mitosporidium daphniae]|eukprot:XP_013238616.1 uncharacterized protein DI09_1p390 [Mitosporidium daphniae]
MSTTGIMSPSLPKDTLKPPCIPKKKRERNHENPAKSIYTITSYKNQHGPHAGTPFLITDSSAVDPSISLEVHRHKNAARKPNHWKVTASTPFVKYETHSQGHAPSFATKHAIAVVDNNTKSIQWVEPQFFQLSTTPLSIKKIDPLTLSAASIVNADAARIANTLGQSFGTRKKIQAIKSKERDVVRLDMISTAESSSINASIDTKVKKRPSKPPTS